MTNNKWIYVTVYASFIQEKLLHNLGNVYIKAITQPRVFSSITSLCPFHVIDGGYIKALLRRVYSYRIQHIIQGLDLEPISTLAPPCLNDKPPHI